MVARFAKIERNPNFSRADPRFSTRAAACSGTSSKRTDREIAQPQVGEAALLPDPEQRPIQRQPDHLIALSDCDADAFAEIAVVGVGTAAKGAAIFGIRAIEPERERDRVTKQEIDLASPQSGARGVRVRIGPDLDLGKQSLKIALARGAGDHRDLLALEPLGQRS